MICYAEKGKNYPSIPLYCYFALLSLLPTNFAEEPSLTIGIFAGFFVLALILALLSMFELQRLHLKQAKTGVSC